jgi:hypothetical protein
MTQLQKVIKEQINESTTIFGIKSAIEIWFNSSSSSSSYSSSSSSSSSGSSSTRDVFSDDSIYKQ